MNASPRGRLAWPGKAHPIGDLMPRANAPVQRKLHSKFAARVTQASRPPIYAYNTKSRLGEPDRRTTYDNSRRTFLHPDRNAQRAGAEHHRFDAARRG